MLCGNSANVMQRDRAEALSSARTIFAHQTAKQRCATCLLPCPLSKICAQKPTVRNRPGPPVGPVGAPDAKEGPARDRGQPAHFLPREKQKLP